MNWRRIIFGIIIIICIVAINLGVYWSVTEETSKQPQEPVVKVDTEKVVNEFKNIFDNTIDYQNYSVSNVTKTDSDKELIYTKTSNNNSVDGKYEFNVSVPAINISKKNIDIINEEIQSIFYSKVNSIMSGQTEISTENTLQTEEIKKINTVIYDVKYKAYVNSNILSLIIKANLKEGVSNQRTFIKTYNINLTTYEQINITQLAEIKGLNNQTINAEIKQVVKNANKEAENLQTLGFSVYIRDENSEIYDIEKTKNLDCFLGKNQMMYIIYPYGNKDNTNEMDIVLFQ